jgi:biotin transport system ATP-binding protein
VTLIVRNLKFSYPKSEKELFGDLSFNIDDGDVLVVLGANGTGKSTLLDILAGLTLPSKGIISLDGNEDSLSLRVSLVPENPDHFILGATVEEELTLGLGLYDKPKLMKKDSAPPNNENSDNIPSFSINDQKQSDKTHIIQTLPISVESLAQSWSLDSLLHEPVENLSRGEKKRLALASALASRPLVVLLDEPFSGLDYPGILSLKKDLHSLKDKGHSLVLVTHEPMLTEDLADSYLLLKQGAYIFTKKENLDKELFGEYGIRPF